MKTKINLIGVGIIVFVILLNTIAIQYVKGGSVDDPEIKDPPDDTDDQPGDENEKLDIIAGWFSEERETKFKVTIQIKNITEYEANTGYVFHWKYNETEYFARLTVEETKFIYDYGRINRTGTNPNYQKDGETTGMAGGGEGAKILIDVPKEGVGSPKEGDSLTESGITTYRDRTTTIGTISTRDEIDNNDNPGRDYVLGKSAAEKKITLSPTSTSKQVKSGKSVDYKISVSTNSEEAVDVELYVQEVPLNWEAEIEPSSVSVKINNPKTVTLNVTAPKKAKENEKAVITITTTSSLGETSINITATAIGGEEEDDNNEDLKTYAGVGGVIIVVLIIGAIIGIRRKGRIEEESYEEDGDLEEDEDSEEE